MLARLKSNWLYLAIAALLVVLDTDPLRLVPGAVHHSDDFHRYLHHSHRGSVPAHGLYRAGIPGTGCLLRHGRLHIRHLEQTCGVNPWLAMLIAAVMTGAFAYIIGYPIFRLKGNYLAMATLGLGLIMWILFRQLSQSTGGPDGISGIPHLSIGGFVFDTPSEGISWSGSSAWLSCSSPRTSSGRGQAERLEPSMAARLLLNR